MDRKEILNKAEEIINGDREGTYGKPEDSFARIAQLWSVYLNHDISSVDVANMMVLLKVARNAGGVYKDDNWIDICGYAALGGEIQSRFDYDSFGQFMNKPVEEEARNIPVHAVTTLYFHDKGKASDIMVELNNSINANGFTSVASYYRRCEKYDLVKNEDWEYGWTKPIEGDILFDRHGWSIDLPEPERLKKKNCCIGKAGASGDPKGDNVPYPVKDMEFDSLLDAVHATFRMKSLIKNYGSCSVNDYYTICGKTCTKYIDTKYGWNDLCEFEHEKIISFSDFGKWIIKMPPAVKLNKGENE